MADAKMVVVNGVRYRAEDAPEQPKKGADTEASTAEHKKREPRAGSARSRRSE